MNEFINELILPHFGTFISAVLTGLAGFVFGKRKQTAEVEGINADNEGKEIENAEKVLKYYRAMVDDLGEKLITAIKELDEAKQVIKELEDKVELLTDELKKYKQLNRKKEE